MAYITKEETAVIREEIKKAFPEFKFSVSMDNHSGVCVSVLSGPIKLEPKHREVNVYWIDDHYKDDKIARDFFNKILEIMSKNWYDKSDMMTDYHNTAFYRYIYIGRWNKDYILTEKKVTAKKEAKTLTRKKPFISWKKNFSSDREELEWLREWKRRQEAAA